MTIKWTHFDADLIKEIHGNLFFYRKLYEGKHSEIFSRAKNLIEKGEIVDEIIYGTKKAQNVQTPYIIANLSKLIPEVPALLISRSIGAIQSSLSADEKQNKSINKDTDAIIDGPEDGTVNSEISSLQQEVIRQIGKNSNLAFEHWGNVVQHQVDGGLVGVPWNDERGLRIEFKARDVYYPHDDGLGVDLAYDVEIEGDDYLHVYRERVVNGANLQTEHLLYELNESRKCKLVEKEETGRLLGLDELKKLYVGRGRPFVIYWPNEKTFMNPLGVSCLVNQEGKQDEINWTLTRNALTFERNGKPRLAVSKEIMQALQEKAYERYGDESRIDHRDLEITTFDEHGKALEIVQVDITKIGDVQWVKDLMKMMLMETQTSEKAIDFFADRRSEAQSGVAKFYDLFTSLLKAEQLQSEYIYFLQQLIESALWLANKDDSTVIIEEPEITLRSMIPVNRKELIDENNAAYEGANGKAAQSLETTVRRNNPYATEEWIQEELARIESEQSTDDSYSLLRGRQTMQQMMGNKDADGNPIIEKEDDDE